MTARFVIGIGSFVSAVILIAANAFAEPQDPPGRVGRLSLIEGAVQQRTADDASWTHAELNYPVTNGFAVATGEGGRAEIQAGSMAVRVGGDSELDVNELADHSAALTLARGEINLRVDRLAERDHVEIVTPRGAVEIVSAGRYHFDAGTTGSPTRVAVFSGRVEIPRSGNFTVLSDGQAALITGDGPPDITLAATSTDALDDWAFARDRGGDRVAARDYVSPEMTGGNELGQYGDWRHDPRYGEVWYPTAVPAGWAPYRYGHWAWVSPWGWTWIDDEPWGFAPFHYGRWVHNDDGWGWVPGVIVEHPIFAPALVAFVGSPVFVGVGLPAVAWFPLAPFEVFIPAFPVSIVFVRNINITNINITKVRITRVNGAIVVDNTANVTVSSFANRQFVTTVSKTAFTSGQSVNRTVLTRSTTRIATTAPVSWAPANATAPRTAAVTGWRGTGAGMAVAKPPLPTARTASSRSAGTGNVAAEANSALAGTAGTFPNRGQHSLPPLPGSDAARTAISGATNGPGGKDGATASAITATGHRLPPLPSGTPRTAASTIDGGPADTGAASHHVVSMPFTNRAPHSGSSTAFNASRVGAPSPHVPPVEAPITSRTGAHQTRPSTAFDANRVGAPSPHMAMPPVQVPITSHAGAPQPNTRAMAHGGAPVQGGPMRAGPAAQPRGSGQPGGRGGSGQNQAHLNNG
jgi:hypothetical protein